MITTLLSTFVLWIALFLSWFWLGYEKIPNEMRTIYDNLEYDYIIVGAGTAGCVIANRLSANESNRVLLIESGRHFGPLSILPITATMLQGTNVDWNFKTTSQKYSSRGLFNGRQFWPRGKGLGGSSQLNYMLHFDGDSRDFDEWEKKVGPMWGYEKMKKYLENAHDSCGVDEAGNGMRGSCSRNDASWESNFSYYDELSESNLSNLLVQAGEELKYVEVEDVDLENVRVDVAKYNIKNGKRFSVYQQYLKPAFTRKNLIILTETRVHKVSEV